MKTRQYINKVRLLPAVIAVAGGLLAIKSLDLVQAARAEAPAAQPSEASAAPAAAAKPDAKTADAAHAMPAAPASADPALDPAAAGGSDSASEMDVLTSLSKRRDELDARAKALDMRANLLAAAEKRVDGKIADLKALEKQIQGLLGQRDAAEQKQIAALVKVYSAMKPRDAGRIFNSLDENVLLEVAAVMKPDALAAIMATMDSQRAQDLTVKLANKDKLPAKPDLSTSQLAAAGADAGGVPSGN